MPLSGIYKIKGDGDVLTGRVEQGAVKPNEEVVFLPTNTKANPCTGKVFTVEMHHKRADQALPGDVMVYKKDTSLAGAESFVAQIQTLDIPGEIKVGYSPIGFVRCGRSACKLKEIQWKVGKETAARRQSPL